MRVAMRLLSGWPGLPQLWLRGQWSGLAIAWFFALLVNGAIGWSFLWPGRIPAASIVALWTLVGGLWCLSLWRTQRRFEEIVPSPAGPGIEALFLTAQTQYLQGSWGEAEKLAHRILDQQPDDVETRLLLAALQRRTGRWSQARQSLRELQQWDAARHWREEIQQEWRRVDQAATGADCPNPSHADTADHSSEHAD